MTITDSKNLRISAIIEADLKHKNHLKRILPNAGERRDGSPLRLKIEKVITFKFQPKKVLLHAITKQGDVVLLNQDEVEFFKLIRNAK